MSYKFSAKKKDDPSLRPHENPFNGRKLYGSLQVKINEAIIDRDQVEQKMRDVLDQTQRFDKNFNLYLKLHSKDQHFKSQTNGKLLTEDAYKKIVKNGQIAFRDPQTQQAKQVPDMSQFSSFNNDESQTISPNVSKKYFVAFQVK